MWFVFIACQDKGYRNIYKLSCRSVTFTPYKGFSKNKKRPRTSLLASFSAWFLKKTISLVIFIVIVINYNHSHKKCKDNRETRLELAVLHSYVENKAILESILLYHASKCKQTEEKGSKDCLWNHIFTFFMWLLSVFFVQNASIAGSNCAVIGCCLSKKYKLALRQTQSGEPTYVDQKILL